MNAVIGEFRDVKHLNDVITQLINRGFLLSRGYRFVEKDGTWGVYGAEEIWDRLGDKLIITCHDNVLDFDSEKSYTERDMAKLIAENYIFTTAEYLEMLYPY